MALTDSDIKLMAPPDREKLIGDGQGLYLRVYPSGRKTWLFRSRIGGVWRTRHLGEWPTVLVPAARVKAAQLAGTELPENVTFGDLLDEHLTRQILPRYRVTKNAVVYAARGKQWLGSTLLHKLTAKMLTDRLWEYAQKAPVAANRCLAHWRLALDYAVERGLVNTNVLARTTARVVGGEEKSREVVLSDDEIRALWADTHAHAPLLRFILLTGLRISEAQHARYTHVDGDVLQIPENKSDRPHWVHITALAREQIGGAQQHLFDQRSNTAVQSRLRNTAKARWTPHDLRRTFATRVAGLGVAPHIVEKLLNHTLGGVLATYNRHDYAAERIAATEAWSTEIKRIVNV